MHKTETAGHAGTELGLLRLPVLKLLSGRAATDGAQGSQLEGGSQTRRRCAGPRLEGGVQAVGSPAFRQNEMQRSSLGSRANMEERAKN